MGFKAGSSDFEKKTFIPCDLCWRIIDTAISSPDCPTSLLSDVVREALFEWGVVHMVREKSGGLRLVHADEVCSPFGEMREMQLYLSDRKENKGKRPGTCVSVSPLLAEILNVALEDVPKQYNSFSEIINLAVIQWGLSRFELTHKTGEWDFAEPLRVRQAFDFDPDAPSLKTAALRQHGLNSKGDLFPASDKDRPDPSGSFAIPFYRPSANIDYLDKILTKAKPKESEDGKTAQAAENEGKRTAQKEEENLDLVLELLDSME